MLPSQKQKENLITRLRRILAHGLEFISGLFLASISDVWIMRCPIPLAQTSIRSRV